jgi:nucleotide-binding universal stress UspA family protein
MLRMRPKPPAGLPTINSGKPWSAMDMDDLDELLRQDAPIDEIAEFLCRELGEVEAKVDEFRRQDTPAPEIIRNAVRRWLKEIGAKAADLRRDR